MLHPSPERSSADERQSLFPNRTLPGLPRMQPHVLLCQSRGEHGASSPGRLDS